MNRQIKFEGKKVDMTGKGRSGLFVINHRDEAKAFGNHLRKKKEKRGVTMADVARFLGVAESTYSNYEYAIGKFPAACIPKLCEVLAVTPNELFDYEIPEKKTEAKAETLEDRISALENIVMELVDELRKRS